jgi:hypothetical protein
MVLFLGSETGFFEYCATDRFTRYMTSSNHENLDLNQI